MLTVWYPFIEDGSPKLGIGNTVNGTFNNGMMGKCLWTGTTTYDLGLKDVDYWPYFKESVTISAWLKFNEEEIAELMNALDISNASSTNGYVCGNIWGFHSYGGFSIYYTTNQMFDTSTKERIADFSSIRLSAGIRGKDPSNANYIKATDSHNIPLDTWIHVASIVDKETNSLNLAINGKIVRSVAINYDMMLGSENPYWVTGRSLGLNRSQVFGGNGPSRAIPFNICDFRIYNHALTTLELENLAKACILDLNFNDALIQNTTNILANYTIAGHGSSWTLQDETLHGYPIYKNVVTSPSTGNNAGFRYNSTMNVSTTKSRAYISFYKRLNKVYGKNLIGYFRVNYADGSVSTHTWNYLNGKSNWANDADSIGKWEKIVAYASLSTASKEMTSVNCFYVYTDNAPSGDCDFSQIQIEFSDTGPSAYTESTRSNHPIYDSSGYERDGWNKDCELTDDTMSGSYAISTTGQASGSTSYTNQSFCGVDMKQNIYLNKFTLMTTMYLTSHGHQTSGVLSTSSTKQSSSSGTADYTTSPIRMYDSNFRIRGYDSSGTAAVTNIAQSVLPKNAWYHFCLVYDGTTFKAYRNGSQVASSSTSIVELFPFRYFYIGLDGAGGSYRNATLKCGSLKLYANALSAEDIKFEYETNVALDSDGILYADEFIEEEDSASEIASWYRTSRANTFIEPSISEYTPIEYIESTGTQYIDTGYALLSDDAKICADITVLSNTSNQSLWGNEEYTAASGTSRYFSLIPHGKSGSFSIYAGTSATSTINISLNNRRFVELIAKDNKYQYSLDGVTVSSGSYNGSVSTKSGIYQTSTASSTVGHIFIFSNHNSDRGSSNSATQYISAMRLYSFQIYDYGKLVRDFIPVKRNTDNVVGLYDKLNGNFYTNKGTGNFIAGRELYLDEYTCLDYIESTGTQYIDTEYIPTQSNIKIELDMAWTGSNLGLFETFAGFMYSTSTVTPRIGIHKLSNVYMYGANNTSYTDIQPVKNERTIVIGDFHSGTSSILYKDGEEIYSYTNSYSFASNTCPVYIFGRYCPNSMNLAYMRLYNCKIYDNNILIRDFIPVIRNYNQEAGLYDKINKKFYKNLGTNAFTCGSVLGENEDKLCEVYENHINAYEIIEK